MGKFTGLIPTLIHKAARQVTRGPGVALLLLVPLAGCQNPPASKPATPVLYLFPKSKPAPALDYSLTKAEKQAALRKLRQMRGELLYEVIVDRAGTVQKIRVVKRLAGEDQDYYTIGFMHRIKDYRFSASTNPAPYRTFFYPMQVNSTTEFLGNEVFLD